MSIGHTLRTRKIYGAAFPFASFYSAHWQEFVAVSDFCWLLMSRCTVIKFLVMKVFLSKWQKSSMNLPRVRLFKQWSQQRDKCWQLPLPSMGPRFHENQHSKKLYWSFTISETSLTPSNFSFCENCKDFIASTNCSFEKSDFPRSWDEIIHRHSHSTFCTLTLRFLL